MTHGNLTHGGIPEADALHWNHETYQRFGRIVQFLASSNPVHRRKGYVDYHEMHRHFMAAEWDNLIRELDLFRIAHHHLKISDLLLAISKDLVEKGFPAQAAEVSAEIPPYEVALKELDKTIIKTKQYSFTVKDSEQLSLFG